MTTVQEAVVSQGSQLKAKQLPGFATPAVAVGAIIVGFALVNLAGLGGQALSIVLSLVFFLAGIYAVSTAVEGRRRAKNRMMTTLIWSAFVIALLPLVSVAYTLISKGAGKFNPAFWQHSMNGVGPRDDTGGAYHAIIGTLEQAGIATVITVPLGVLAAIYIVEYGRGWFSNAIRFFVDVMTGIPSIVAGLFVLAFWVFFVTKNLNHGTPVKSGFAAALALSILMLPTIVRSSEEMLRLVPGALREGAYALGVAKWKTIMSIVLPTAAPGIVTGAMLAIARACGETAPVLLVAGGNNRIITNPFSDQQSSLSYFVFEQAQVSTKYGPPRAWAAALTLVVIVLVLTIAAKLLARRNKLAR
jgi:phosphate transport system permease protein